jgi:predicted enzyme related to lactoylglutathione lyase
MTTHIQTPLQVKTFAPALTVDNLQQSIRLFEGLGFAVDERWEEKGALLGVMMRAGDAQIGLNQDDWTKGRDRQKGIGMRILIGTTQDVDEIASRLRAAGVSLDTEPRDTPEGRAFEVSDPTGFKVTIWHEKG